MPGAMSEAGAIEKDVRVLLDRWVDATVKRDPQALADLFVRSPDPLVVWPSGEATRGWKDVFAHAQRELYHAKVLVQRVDVHDVIAIDVTADAAEAVFRYDVHATDLWGTSVKASRVATMTFLRTKDGLRVASAHFGAPPPPASPA